MALPTVSIIIPAYNPGPYLREAIRSVFGQSFTDQELVVVDDDSTEDLSWIGREFPSVKVIRQPHGGASVARNNGILNSSARYIAFMDQDDVWRPRKLERQVAAMHATGDAVGVCYCDLSLIDAEGEAIGSADPAQLSEEERAEATGFVEEFDGSCQAEGDGKAARLSSLHRSILYFSSRFIVPSTVMVRRTALATSGLLDPFIPFSGDYDLLIKLGQRHKVIRVPFPDVLYRKHANNFSDQYEVGRREVAALIARYTAYAKSTGDKLLARQVAKLFGRPRRMYAAQAFDRARKSLRERELGAMARHLGRAFWFSPPFVLRPLSRWCLPRRRKVAGGGGAGP